MHFYFDHLYNFHFLLFWFCILHYVKISTICIINLCLTTSVDGTYFMILICNSFNINFNVIFAFLLIRFYLLNKLICHVIVLQVFVENLLDYPKTFGGKLDCEQYV